MPLRWSLGLCLLQNYKYSAPLALNPLPMTARNQTQALFTLLSTPILQAHLYNSQNPADSRQDQ